MVFEQSLLTRTLQKSLLNTLSASNPRRNPESTMTFDSFLEQATLFQPDSLAKDLVVALNNNAEPVFTLGEVAVQIEDPMEALESPQQGHDVSADLIQGIL